MARGALDAAAILAATEDVLRRYGPAKATVQDVARSLGVTHGSVYRHFPSKLALREAVTRAWLGRGNSELAAIAADSGLAPPERLRSWLTAMLRVKQAKAADDPELFANFRELAAQHSDAAAEHVGDLVGQLRGIIADGVQSGHFSPVAPERVARAVFEATTRFHHPAHAGEWQTPEINADLDAVCTLILDGLRRASTASAEPGRRTPPLEGM